MLAMTAAAAVAFAAEAGAQSHPEPTKYEYRWIKGRFVPPYHSFPEGAERGQWKCQSENAASIQCSFIRSGLSRFDYIYRPKRR
jgi:hypothetical protein